MSWNDLALDDQIALTAAEEAFNPDICHSIRYRRMYVSEHKTALTPVQCTDYQHDGTLHCKDCLHAIYIADKL